jgi:hypothetical protein
MADISKRAVARLIYLSGTRLTDFGYTVRCSGFDGMTDLNVPTTRVGNAIVRALRTEALLRPDLFPPSKMLARALWRPDEPSMEPYVEVV